MKKKVLLLLILIIAAYLVTVTVFNSQSTAKAIEVPGELDFYIQWNGKTYIDLSATEILSEGYELITPGNWTKEVKKERILFGNFSEDYLPPFNYITPYNTDYDPNNAFVIYNPQDSSLNIKYVDMNFTVPEISTDAFDGVWFSLNTEYENNINDESDVAVIVECILNGNLQDLDAALYDKLIDESWREDTDTYTVFLKFKDCPIALEYPLPATSARR